MVRIKKKNKHKNKYHNQSATVSISGWQKQLTDLVSIYVENQAE